jgi:hypothetical protein
MMEKLKALLFGERWRRDEYAWRVWQGLAPRLPQRFPAEWESISMSGRVVRVYQRARRGTKATVDFGPVLGVQDTWWPFMRAPKGRWVVVTVHLWSPPGTHSGRHVLWVDHWESWAPGDTAQRARRHQRRLEKEQLRAGREQVA